MDADNPAQRLYDLLEKAFDAKTYPKEKNCREVWQSLLGTPLPGLLMARLGKVMALPEQVLDAIDARHPGDRKHHQHWVAQLTAAFEQQNLAGQWASFRAHTTKELLASIAMAASALRVPGEVKRLTPEDLGKLTDTISAMREKVWEADIDESMKRYLLDQLRKMQAAVDEYFLTGAAPVVDAIDATIGHMAVREEYRSFLRTPEGQDVLHGLGGIAAAVTIAKEVPALIYAAAALLLN